MRGSVTGPGLVASPTFPSAGQRPSGNIDVAITASARFLKELGARITVYTKERRVLVKEHIDRLRGRRRQPRVMGPRRREVPLA